MATEGSKKTSGNIRGQESKMNRFNPFLAIWWRLEPARLHTEHLGVSSEKMESINSNEFNDNEDIKTSNNNNSNNNIYNNR